MKNSTLAVLAGVGVLGYFFLKSNPATSQQQQSQYGQQRYSAGYGAGYGVGSQSGVNQLTRAGASALQTVLAMGNPYGGGIAPTGTGNVGGYRPGTMSYLNQQFRGGAHTASYIQNYALNPPTTYAVGTASYLGQQYATSLV
jgi:hypothetical protein